MRFRLGMLLGVSCSQCFFVLFLFFYMEMGLNRKKAGFYCMKQGVPSFLRCCTGSVDILSALRFRLSFVLWRMGFSVMLPAGIF